MLLQAGISEVQVPRQLPINCKAADTHQNRQAYLLQALILWVSCIEAFVSWDSFHHKPAKVENDIV
jgi:hypothetical protein